MMQFIRLFIAFSLPAMCLANSPDEKIHYKTVGDVTLNLHVFKPAGHKSSDKRPALLFFFGGGWSGGSPQQFYNQSEYLASRGMVAFAVEYRVKKQHGTAPSACVSDGKSAMRWVRAHAKELGVDPNKIAAGGGSAGGHVAAATALAKGFDAEGEDITVSCRPDALVLFNPVFDNSPEGYGYSRVSEYWEDISPLHNINKTAPPTIVFLGDKDKLIPVRTAEAYKTRMEKVGARCDLHVYENQPHGFFNKARYTETVYEMDKFLSSLGFLEGEPTLIPSQK